ncbi:MAG: ribosome biogenesis GTP-binding protein YihA/YsxC [Brachymonas sp.]|nr:ribosome biogenesis GTP-binding protein YihA/YsxC [Brachymonas sp.]MDO4794720.1 ribosome biogenesis GTP-binding protein YihA/YsxC [Brachymonas sp.]
MNRSSYRPPSAHRNRPAPALAAQTSSPSKPAALGWMHTARFLTTAAQLHQLPPLDVPEIAFVGRSNAGKSTCINTLTQQKQLAFASKTPGRTQHINLFALGRQGQTDAVLADLPGYGYAAVPLADKERWQQVMAHYLCQRGNLAGIVMLCDARLGLTELDELLLELIRPRVEEGLPFLVLLTKADKLTRTEGAKALDITRLQAGGGQVMLFSALKKQGLETVAQWLWDTASQARAAAATQADEAAAANDPAAATSSTGGASPAG